MSTAPTRAITGRDRVFSAAALSVVSVRLRPEFSRGYNRSNCCAKMRTELCACSRLIPGLSRPAAENNSALRCSTSAGEGRAYG